MIDGVYIGLPHEEHVRAPGRLGSTDFTALYSRGPGWWWTSQHNPHYARKETEPLIFGSAAHALLHEGREAFQDRYAVMPNPREFGPDLLTSSEELRSALIAAGAPINSKTKKNDLVQAAKAYLPGRPVWDDIVERWERTAGDKAHLTSAEGFALEAMYGAASEDPSIRVLCGMDSPVKLVEVSVLYTCALGLRKRYRFDHLLPTANVDTKTLGDWRSKPLEELAADRIRQDHLDVQLAMSHEARLAAYAMIEAGNVFAPSQAAGERYTGDWENFSIDHQKAASWLGRFPREAPLNHPDPNGTGQPGPGWCWAWLFIQKPEGGAAPGLLPLRVLWGDDVHLRGWRKLKIAERCYIDNVNSFGLSKPWTQVRPLHDTSHAAARRVVIREWDEPAAQDNEREAMSWRA